LVIRIFGRDAWHHEGVTERVSILGVSFARLSPEQALDEAVRLHDAERPAWVAHANAHTLNLAGRDVAYRAALGRADLLLNDGKGVMLAARLLGSAFPADLNGNFFSPLVLRRAAARGWPVYFLGAKPGVAAQAAAELSSTLEGLAIVGVRDGYFRPDQEDEVSSSIASSGAEVVMVGLGNPAQELWLDRCLVETGARLGIGVGAFFDFQAGEIARAPAWMNRVGMEWVHRLALEPTRMWRRYLVGNPEFLARVAADRWSRVEGRARR
jgi:exopolysaccharide biosynthesis WecB/TagA/CpsF family protein